MILPQVHLRTMRPRRDSGGSGHIRTALSGGRPPSFDLWTGTAGQPGCGLGPRGRGPFQHSDGVARGRGPELRGCLKSPAGGSPGASPGEGNLVTTFTSSK